MRAACAPWHCTMWRRRAESHSGPDIAALSAREVTALLAVLALISAPHAAHSALWPMAASALFIGYRLTAAWRSWPLPGAWLRLALVILVCAGILLDFSLRFGRDAAVSMLLLMAGLKSLELRTPRDAIVVINLGYFLIVTSFLYLQSLFLALYMLVLLVLVTALLMALQRRASAAFPMGHTVRNALVLLLQGVPLMLLLFLLFPRVQGPLFGWSQSTSTAVSGLSEEMSPGSLSSLSLSDEVAFRAQFDGPAPKAATLYWRGPVLWDFDGRTWRMARTALLDQPRHESAGEPVRYQVTLEANQSRWLFAIDLPRRVPIDAVLSADYQMLSRQPLRQRQRYRMESDLRYVLSRQESPQALQRALRLPPDGNRRARQLAGGFRARAHGARQVVEQALAHFRTERFFYTLVPPELGAEPVDEFLFGTRRGFCEHYASSFVFLMRAAGVPARVVTGYLGGEVNPLGDYLIVRQSEAHAWAEVWLAGEGWVRIDPTAAVSPARIEVGLAAAVPAGEPVPAAILIEWQWLRQARFALDALTNSWNQWVLGYGRERQMQLLSRMGMGQVQWQQLTLALMAFAGAATLILSLFLLKDIHLRRRPPAVRAYRRFQRKLARVGVAPRAGEAPLAYAARAIAANTCWAAAIDDITARYLTICYGAGPSTGPGAAAQIRALARAVRNFKP